ncbi:hypothetical protein ACFL4D_03430, partial [Candidatus Margulisiibacteriota bacterium]
LIIDRPTDRTLLIEIKSAESVDERDTRILNRFMKDFPHADAMVISRDKHEKLIDRVLALPWDIALQRIFQ